jgi:hypothetical protein
MLTRIDHPIIAVRDLDQAVSACTALGFSVVPGGRNPGLGTYNALIRFGLDYLELLSVDDRAACLASHPRGHELVRFLDTHMGGLLSFVVASDDLDADIVRAEANDWQPGRPTAMQRVRPDGTVLRWRLLMPGEESFRQPWPLLIEWQTPDDERLRCEPRGTHANGAVGVSGLTLVVPSLTQATRLYGAQLGLAVHEARVELPGCPIDLVEGEDVGLCEVRLAVRGQLPPPVDVLGARLVFVASR